MSSSSPTTTNGLLNQQQQQQQSPIAFYPFAYALFDECLTKHCWYCLDDERKHKRCTGCQRALFCDKQCQSLAWKDHKFECRGIKRHGGNVPDIEVRLLGRIVARHKAILCGMDKKDPDFYMDRTSRRNIMDIWAHTKNMAKDEYAIRKFEDIYERLCRFYDAKALLNRQTVFELHCRDFINRHAISDRHYLREIGKGLYLDLCAYDHSCRPNTVYSCRSFIAILRPLNSQVNLLDRSATFYAYIDLLCAKQDRRKLLKDTWYFNCECDRCVDESEHVLTSMLCPNCPEDGGKSKMELCIFGQPEYKDAESQLIKCPECGKTVEKEQVMEAVTAMRFISDVLDKTNLEKMGQKEAVEFLEDLLQKFSQLLPPVNVYLCKIVQALLPFVDQDDSRRLLELHLLVEKCIRICYPQNHPALAFHLRNIGIFAKCIGKRQMAMEYLREAREMFNFVMGPDHSLTTMTEEILEETKKMVEDVEEKMMMMMNDENEKPKRKKEEGKDEEEEEEEEELKKDGEEVKKEEKNGKEDVKKKGKKRRGKNKKEEKYTQDEEIEKKERKEEEEEKMKNSGKKNEEKKREKKKPKKEGRKEEEGNGKKEEKWNEEEERPIEEKKEDENGEITIAVPKLLNLPEVMIEEEKEEMKKGGGGGDDVPILEVEMNAMGDEVEEMAKEDGSPKLVVEVTKEEEQEPCQTVELFLQIGHQNNGSRPGSALSASSANSLSPQQAEGGGGGGHSPGGVKKKLQTKKCSPRARTPMYPKKKNEDGCGMEEGSGGMREKKGMKREEEEEEKMENVDMKNGMEEAKKEEVKDENMKKDEELEMEGEMKSEERMKEDERMNNEEKKEEEVEKKEEVKEEEIKKDVERKLEEKKARSEESKENGVLNMEDDKLMNKMKEAERNESREEENGNLGEEKRGEEVDGKGANKEDVEKKDDGWQQQKNRKNRKCK